MKFLKMIVNLRRPVAMASWKDEIIRSYYCDIHQIKRNGKWVWADSNGREIKPVFKEEVRVMRDNEIILQIRKNGSIKLPYGFLLLNGLEEGDIVKVIVEKLEEVDER